LIVDIRLFKSGLWPGDPCFLFYVIEPAGIVAICLLLCLIALYPIQKVTEIYNKVTEMYKKVTELEISSWNVLSLLRSEVAYIGTEPILP
jgi:hypothetical protein